MKFGLLLILIFNFVSCDRPARTRFPTTSGSDPIDAIINGDGGGQNVSDNDNGSDDDITETDDDLTEPGYDNCSLTGYPFWGGSSIGYLNICQNSLNESTFKLKMANSDTSTGTCFIPVHIQSNGSSFNVGIAECFHNQANKVYDMILSKNRGESVNGVFVIKAGTPVNEYFRCMSAKTDYLSGFQYPSVVNQQCYYSSQNADVYANCVCNNFKNAFSAYYKEVSL